MGNRPRRTTFIEDDNLGIGVTEELRCQQRKQGRLARPGRADDHGVTNIAGMQVQVKRCCALGLANEQGRRIKMRVPALARPDGRKR